jgi:hypothetical protein
MPILVDSGSSHTFLNASILPRISYQTTLAPPLRVKVPNGQVVLSTEEVHHFEWWIQGHTFSTSTRMLELGAYGMILGMDWLEQHSPIQCDWVHKTIGYLYCLKGIMPPEAHAYTKILGEQLLKLQKGNDLRAIVILPPLHNFEFHAE